MSVLPSKQYDAVVVGAGPNGLAAAITLARAGRSVLVVEAKDTAGGGSRSMELTLPGFVHDVCSAIHPLALGSPFFCSLPLERYGLEWIHPSAPLAHPLDDGSAVVLERSVAETVQGLGSDAQAYQALMDPLIRDSEKLIAAFLGPLRPQTFRAPLAAARFGLNALLPATLFARSHFRTTRARALMAGLAAHSMMPLENVPSAGFGLILLLLAHVIGWPMPRGGAQKIIDALVAYLASLGGEVVSGVEVKSFDLLPPARAVLCDLTPRQLLRIAGDHLPPGYRRSLQHYRYGPGVFKVDYALNGPIPWCAEDCLRAGTVHLGGTLPEIAASERQISLGAPAERPFVLLAQQSLFDPSRAPEGKQVAWAYCHVPNGSTYDMTEHIEAQIERFAPGFRQRILARHTMNTADMERYDANYVGGDINGGIQDLGQFFTRPTIRLVPYSTPAKMIYLCSSSTPPGGGVHGMCGYFAAQAALHAVLR